MCVTICQTESLVSCPVALDGMVYIIRGTPSLSPSCRLSCKKQASERHGFWYSECRYIYLRKEESEQFPVWIDQLLEG